MDVMQGLGLQLRRDNPSVTLHVIAAISLTCLLSWLLIRRRRTWRSVQAKFFGANQDFDMATVAQDGRAVLAHVFSLFSLWKGRVRRQLEDLPLGLLHTLTAEVLHCEKNASPDKSCCEEEPKRILAGLCIDCSDQLLLSAALKVLSDRTSTSANIPPDSTSTSAGTTLPPREHPGYSSGKQPGNSLRKQTGNPSRKKPVNSFREKPVNSSRKKPGESSREHPRHSSRQGSHAPTPQHLPPVLPTTSEQNTCRWGSASNSSSSESSSSDTMVKTRIAMPCPTECPLSNTPTTEPRTQSRTNSCDSPSSITRPTTLRTVLESSDSEEMTDNSSSHSSDGDDSDGGRRRGGRCGERCQQHGSSHTIPKTLASRPALNQPPEYDDEAETADCGISCGDAAPEQGSALNKILLRSPAMSDSEAESPGDSSTSASEPYDASDEDSAREDNSCMSPRLHFGSTKGRSAIGSPEISSGDASNWASPPCASAYAASLLSVQNPSSGSPALFVENPSESCSATSDTEQRPSNERSSSLLVANPSSEYASIESGQTFILRIDNLPGLYILRLVSLLSIENPSTESSSASSDEDSSTGRHSFLSVENPSESSNDDIST